MGQHEAGAGTKTQMPGGTIQPHSAGEEQGRKIRKRDPGLECQALGMALMAVRF